MLAIIPARGGSKGLPGKNVKMLHGKPLIAYTIEAALAAKNITRVIVSTDDDRIAEVSRKFGADVPFMRPEYLATDDATSRDVILHAIETLTESGDNFINEFVILQPTSPLRNHEDIDNAIRIFRDKQADAVISYCREAHPIRWHKYLDEEGKLVDIFEGVGKIRQDERPSYFPNGAIYVYTTKYLKSEIGEIFPYLMSRIKSVDIDTNDDFEYVEYLISKNKYNNLKF